MIPLETKYNDLVTLHGKTMKLSEACVIGIGGMRGQVKYDDLAHYLWLSQRMIAGLPLHTPEGALLRPDDEPEQAPRVCTWKEFRRRRAKAILTAPARSYL